MKLLRREEGMEARGRGRQWRTEQRKMQRSAGIEGKKVECVFECEVRRERRMEYNKK